MHTVIQILTNIHAVFNRVMPFFQAVGNSKPGDAELMDYNWPGELRNKCLLLHA